MLFILFVSVVFYLDFTACQDYFIHLGLSQSVGGAKTGGETPDHPQVELDLSHMSPELGSNPQG